MQHQNQLSSVEFLVCTSQSTSELSHQQNDRGDATSLQYVQDDRASRKHVCHEQEPMLCHGVGNEKEWLSKCLVPKGATGNLFATAGHA